MFERIKATKIYQGTARILKSILGFIRKFLRDWGLSFSAMLSYYLLVGLVPMAVAALGIAGLVLDGHPLKQKKLIDQIMSIVPNATVTQSVTKEIVTTAVVKLSDDAGALLALGLVVAIFGASQFFVAVDKCLTIIYRVKDRTFGRRSLMAMGMVLLFLILFALVIVATSAPSVLASGVKNKGERIGIYILGVICAIAADFILFEIIYWIIVNKKMSLRTTWCGSLVAACLLEVVAVWYPYYVETNTTSYMGAVGVILLFILLLYYFSLILILGAQINAYCFEDYVAYGTPIGSILSEVHTQYEAGAVSRQPLLPEKSDTIPLKYDQIE